MLQSWRQPVPTNFTVTYIQFTGIYYLKHRFHAQIFLFIFTHTDNILVKCTTHLSMWKVDTNQPHNVTEKFTPIHVSTHLVGSESIEHTLIVIYCKYLVSTIHSLLHQITNVVVDLFYVTNWQTVNKTDIFIHSFLYKYFLKQVFVSVTSEAMLSYHSVCLHTYFLTLEH